MGERVGVWPVASEEELDGVLGAPLVNGFWLSIIQRWFYKKAGQLSKNIFLKRAM